MSASRIDAPQFKASDRCPQRRAGGRTATAYSPKARLRVVAFIIGGVFLALIVSAVASYAWGG